MNNKYTAINGTDNYFYYIDDNGNHCLMKREMRQKMNIKTRQYEGEAKEVFTDCGYYCDVHSMINGVVRDMGKDKQQSGEFKDILEHIKFIEEQYDKLIELCRGL